MGQLLSGREQGLRDRVLTRYCAGEHRPPRFSAANGDSGSPPVSSTPADRSDLTQTSAPHRRTGPVASAAPRARPRDARRKNDLQPACPRARHLPSRFGAYPSSEGGTQWACKTGLEAALFTRACRARSAVQRRHLRFCMLGTARPPLVARLDASVTPNPCGAAHAAAGTGRASAVLHRLVGRAQAMRARTKKTITGLAPAFIAGNVAAAAASMLGSCGCRGAAARACGRWCRSPTAWRTAVVIQLS